MNSAVIFTACDTRNLGISYENGEVALFVAL